MKMFKILMVILIIIVLFNIPPLSYLLKENYTYSNVNGSFISSEEGGKGFNYLSVKRSYEAFLSQKGYLNPSIDKRLFRTFTFKPWYIWEWSDMIFHSERFLLPYLDAATINAR